MRQANRGLLGGLYTIDAKDAALERQPFYIEFEPDAQVAAGQTEIVSETISWRDFICTSWGFTSETVGFPATAGRWKLYIEDVAAQKTFQPRAFNPTAVIGGNFGTGDNPSKDMPVPWIFLEKTVIRVQFTSLNGLDCLPTLVMSGYLTNWEAEATAAIERNRLQLAIMHRQAGEGLEPDMRNRYR